MRKILYIALASWLFFSCGSEIETEEDTTLGKPFTVIDIKLGMTIKETRNVLDSIGYSHNTHGNDLLSVQNCFEIEGYTFSKLFIDFKNGKCYRLILESQPLKENNYLKKISKLLDSLYINYKSSENKEKQTYTKEWKDSTYLVKLTNYEDSQDTLCDNIFLHYELR